MKLSTNGMKHIHLSAVDGLTVFFYFIIFAFILRLIQAQLGEGHPVGDALRFIH